MTELPRVSFAFTSSEDTKVCLLSEPSGDPRWNKMTGKEQVAEVRRNGLCSDIKANVPAVIYFNPNPPIAVEKP